MAVAEARPRVSLPPRKQASVPVCDVCSRPQVSVFCGPDEDRVLARVCEERRCRREVANYLRDVALAIDVTPIPGAGDAGKVEVSFVDGELVSRNGA